MPDRPTTLDLPQSVRQMLDAVRRRIRAYVWVQGLAAIIIAAGLAFWLGLAVDWLFEPSPTARRVGLIAAGCVVLYVCYRYLLRRAFVSIPDTTVAVLLERRFPALKDHLITAVDVASAQSHAPTYNPNLVARTNESARASIGSVKPGELFNRRPLVRSIVAATALIASLIAFAAISRNVFGFYIERLALSDQPWPRRVHLEVVGFPANADGQRAHKLAQDDDFELLVHARTDGYDVPKEVEIRYRLADGRRGRDTLTRVGEAAASQGDYQLFRYEFKHVVGDMNFDIVGGDDRVRDLHLQVVDRPELVSIELACEYPDYLSRQLRHLPVTGGMRIPEGTKLTLHANSTKPLTAAHIHTAKDKKETNLSLADNPQKRLDFHYGTLTADDVLLINVTDTDGVATREPYRISVSAVQDEVPQVAVRLSGISTAITPDAILPIVGKITDDYALKNAWYEYQIDSGAAQSRPLAQNPAGQTAFEKFDTFDTRAVDSATGKRALELKPKQRLALTLKASDNYNLDAKKLPSKTPVVHAGSSQQFTLDIVTPAELLALLERRELALRQRFESIYEKLTDTRNLLSRVGADESTPPPTDPKATPPNAKPGAASDPASTTPAAAADHVLSRTRLRVSGSLQNVVQSTDEIIGVAEAFDDLGEELVNNRIDNSDLKSRLGEQIARPLHQIAQQRMPQLSAQLKLVEEHIEDSAATVPELKKSIALADQILVEMRRVLDRMLELETYNEVVSLLRDIISDQDQINKRTKEQQKTRLRSLFQD
jgi:hypothetical protein